MDPAAGFVVLALLTLLAGIMTALEVAVASLSRLRLAALLETHPRQQPMIRALMDTPERVIGAVALLTDAILVLAGIVAGLLAIRLVPTATPWGQAGLALAVALGYLIVLGRLVPPPMGRHRLAGWVLGLLRPLYWVIRPIFPVVRASDGVRYGLRRMLFPQANPPDSSPLNEDQVRDLLEYLLEEAERYGIVAEEEERMIWRILNYDDLVVRQVMIPRPEVVMLSIETPIGRIREIVAEEGHSRYPVYEETHDNIVGILHAKDLLAMTDDDERPLSEHRDLIRPPFLTPTIKPINDLLHEFQSHKKHMATVVDEFGGLAGIITLEDVLEEIVGEISDEYDEPQRLLRALSEQEYIAEADAELSTINEQLGLRLPVDGAVTIGGLITEHLEEIPRPGRSLELEGVTITVESATAREVLKVRIRLPEPNPEEPTADSPDAPTEPSPPS